MLLPPQCSRVAIACIKTHIAFLLSTYFLPMQHFLDPVSVAISLSMIEIIINN